MPGLRSASTAQLPENPRGGVALRTDLQAHPGPRANPRSELVENPSVLTASHVIGSIAHWADTAPSTTSAEDAALMAEGLALAATDSRTWWETIHGSHAKAAVLLMSGDVGKLIIGLTQIPETGDFSGTASAGLCIGLPTTSDRSIHTPKPHPLFLQGAADLNKTTKTRPVTAEVLLAADPTEPGLLPGGTPRSRSTSETPQFLLVPRAYVQHLRRDTLTPIAMAQWIWSQMEQWPAEWATTRNQIHTTLRSLLSQSHKDPFRSQLSIDCADNRNFGEQVTRWFHSQIDLLLGPINPTSGETTTLRGGQPLPAPPAPSEEHDQLFGGQPVPPPPPHWARPTGHPPEAHDQRTSITGPPPEEHDQHFGVQPLPPPPAPRASPTGLPPEEHDPSFGRQPLSSPIMTLSPEALATISAVVATTMTSLRASAASDPPNNSPAP